MRVINGIARQRSTTNDPSGEQIAPLVDLSTGSRETAIENLTEVFGEADPLGSLMAESTGSAATVHNAIELISIDDEEGSEDTTGRAIRDLLL